MRTRPLSIAVVLVAAAGLTACHAPAPPLDGTIDGCTPAIAPGGATAQIEVSDGEGVPEVAFETPLVTDGPQARLRGGTGERADDGDIVDAQYAVYSGKTGDLITSSFAGRAEQPAAAPLRLEVGGESVLAGAMRCAAPGTGIVVTTTISELFGPDAASPALDIRPADTAVTVLEVTEVRPGQAEGNPRPGREGMPAIALGVDGRPGVTFPGSPPPADLVVVQSIEGTGEEVAEGDTALLHYTGIIWETEEVFDSSWERGAPTEFTIDEQGVIPGFADAVIGQPVGSQVMVSIPPSLGYDDPATRPASIGEGEHLLFVIDILDRLEPAQG